jgi:Helix-turn-helix domain
LAAIKLAANLPILTAIFLDVLSASQVVLNGRPSCEVLMRSEHSPQHSVPEAAQKRLLDPPEAARYLRMAKQTLARWRCHGLGPRFVRIGGRIFYDAADLDAFIAANKFQSTAEADQAV